MTLIADLFYRFRSPYSRAAIGLAVYAYLWMVVVGLATLISGPLMGVPFKFL